MRIEWNGELERKLVEDVYKFMKSRDREGIHASDLDQPRKAYWQRIHPLPGTPREIGYWLTGQGHHYYLVLALTGVDDSQEESGYSEELGIHYSPDLSKLKGEFKTSRKPREPLTEDEALKAFEPYRSQCCTYAVASKVNHWNLYVLYMCPKTSDFKETLGPFPRVYTFTWTKQELAVHKKWIITQREAIEAALAAKDHTSLPLCEEFKCMKWESMGRGRPKKPVADCKWFMDHCKPEGRYELVVSPPTKLRWRSKKE